MTDEEKARAQWLRGNAPGITLEELREFNAYYPAYIFRRASGEVWTSCCGRHEVLEADHPILFAHHQREPKNSFQSPPIPMNRCPFCGKPVIVKDLGRSGKRGNLTRYRRAVALRWKDGALWARAYDCGKEYLTTQDLTRLPKIYLTGVYRFVPGMAEHVHLRWDNGEIYYYQVQNGPLKRQKWDIAEPFGFNTEQEMAYDLAGLSEIQKSPFRYCCAEVFAVQKWGEYFIRLLTACCFYPRQIEMLMKAGLIEAVWDLVRRGVKNAEVLDWTKEGPEAFKVDRQVLKRFLKMDGDRKCLEVLRVYRHFGGKFSLEECAGWISDGYSQRHVRHEANVWNVREDKLVRYLAESCGVRGRSFGGTVQYWKDYIEAAQAVGDTLHRDDVLMPRDLAAAHDSAVDRRNAQRERERQKQRRLEELARTEGYKKLRVKLERKYAWSDGKYLIAVPKDAKEIEEEGIKLKHCVGGYADRHVRGIVTILFMRRADKPGEPWLTIEMKGNELRQIHGYKNEGLYSAGGRFAPDPREVHREFLDKWLGWLRAGSPRDKDGRPRNIGVSISKTA